MAMLICIKHYLRTFEAQLMRKLSNTEAELKKRVAYKKACILQMVFLVEVFMQPKTFSTQAKFQLVYR